MLSNIELKSKLEAQIVVMQGKCDEYERLIHEAYEIISELED